MSNLSEEEKKAIEEAKKQIEEVHNLNNIIIFLTDSSTLKILLILINRLQKENEILKGTNEDITSLYLEMKDKIKHKIKYNKVFNDDISKYAVITLEELLKE